MRYYHVESERWEEPGNIGGTVWEERTLIGEHNWLAVAIAH